MGRFQVFLPRFSALKISANLSTQLVSFWEKRCQISQCFFKSLGLISCASVVRFQRRPGEMTHLNMRKYALILNLKWINLQILHFLIRSFPGTVSLEESCLLRRIAASKPREQMASLFPSGCSPFAPSSSHCPKRRRTIANFVCLACVFFEN